MKEYIKYIILFVLVGVIIYLLIELRHNKVDIPKSTTDTFYKIDTLRYYYPVPKDSFIRDTFYYPIIIDKDSLEGDSINGKDTVYAELPIEEKTYEDSTYYVRISGFKPVLEDIRVYPKETTVVKKEYVVEQKNWFQQHISHGLQIGLGYGIINNKPDFFVGYGITIKF